MHLASQRRQQRIFDDGLDGRKAGPPREEHHGEIALGTKVEVAERALQPEEGTLLDLLEHAARERPAGNPAHVQREERVVGGAVGEGECAPAVVAKQDVDVLTGPILQAFGGRELKTKLHHVVGEPGPGCDPGREGAHAGAVRPSRDANVGRGPGLTQQGPAGPDLPARSGRGAPCPR